MDRTVSASSRGSFVLVAALTARHHAWRNHLLALGKGDSNRGLLLLTAALLTLCGALVQHIDPVTLTALLFIGGATLAAFVLVGPPTDEPQNFSALNYTAPARPHEATSTPASAVFTELLSKPSKTGAIDRAAWARLTAHMSHELRTPLNAVLGFSELMSNEVFGPMGSSCYNDYARDIHASGRMLLKSAEDALAITALLTAPERTGGAKCTHLTESIDDALAFHARDFAERGVTVIRNLEPDSAVAGDAQTIRQMLINLLADAASLATNGQTLALSAYRDIDFVHFTIALPVSDRAAPQRPSEGFAMLLARTLAELSGARVLHETTADGGQGWAVSFGPAMQHDLFSARESAIAVV